MEGSSRRVVPRTGSQTFSMNPGETSKKKIDVKVEYDSQSGSDDSLEVREIASYDDTESSEHSDERGRETHHAPEAIKTEPISSEDDEFPDHRNRHAWIERISEEEVQEQRKRRDAEDNDIVRISEAEFRKRGIDRRGHSEKIEEINAPDSSDGSSSSSDSDSLSSSESEASDSDDEDYCMDQSDHSASTELSSSSNDEGYDSEGKECSVKKRDTKTRSARRVVRTNGSSARDSSTKGSGSKREDVLKSSLDSSEMAPEKESNGDGDECVNEPKNVNSSTGSKTREKQTWIDEAKRDEGKKVDEAKRDEGKKEVDEAKRDEGKKEVDEAKRDEGKKFEVGDGSCFTQRRVFDSNDVPSHENEESDEADFDQYKELLDSVLDSDGEGRSDGESNKGENKLPWRFRFEDEVPKPAEKTEHELFIESLFAEMELFLKYEDVGLSSSYKEVEENDPYCPEAETTQYARCRMGKHCLVEDDEIGIFCSYCFCVKLEAKYILPPWAERTPRTKRRRCSSPQKSPVLDGLQLHPEWPGENITSSCIVSKGTVWEIKPGTRQTMYEHQIEGLEFIWKNLAGTIDLDELKKGSDCPNNIGGGCIISHAPGTGKTRLTMVFIETYLKLFPRSRPLIIAPAGMLLTWEEEFKKWKVEFPFHNLNNFDRRNDKHGARAEKIDSWNREQSILGISYHLFERLTGEKSESWRIRKILLQKPGLVVLDEGHMPRSRKSKIWNVLLQLKTEKRIILSGTPFQNNFQELFNILQIVRPAIAEQLAKEKMFAQTPRGMSLSEEATNHAIEELKSDMAPFVHVHKGTILRQSLPGLTDCIVILKPAALQKRLIERTEARQQSLFEFDYEVALISVHPCLYNCLKRKEKEGIDEDELKATRMNPSEGVKTRFLMELVRLSTMRKEKVLVFSQYIEPLMLVEDQLKSSFSWGAKQVLLMKGRMGLKERQALINAFNDPKSESKVLLASTKCCSEGINLVGASMVVLLDVVWNPSVERQAISRAYRLGQKKIVYTYHLMTSGTTEGDKYCRQADKDRLSELVFTSSSNEKRTLDDARVVIEDGVLEDMVADDANLKDVFEKIIYQPKEKDLIETFSIAS